MPSNPLLLHCCVTLDNAKVNTADMPVRAYLDQVNRDEDAASAVGSTIL